MKFNELMRYGLFTVLLLFLAGHNALRAQRIAEKGTVSYVTSQNVYVKFASTRGINIGDTLFTQQGDKLIPALLVSNKSSVSCVCSRLAAGPFQVGSEVIARKIQEQPKPAEPEKQPVRADKAAAASGERSPEARAREEDGPLAAKTAPKQRIRARLSAASYSNFADTRESTRMRYSFSLQGKNLMHSKLSTDVYVTFRHTLREWEAVRGNLNDALKIYSLAVKYAFSERTSLGAGRMINPNISNLGAVDGVQFETGTGHFLFGAIAGSRPDYLDYSINTGLLQAGAYVGLVSRENERSHQTVLGIIEQHNQSAIDRRFVYVQHSDEWLKNLSVFGSMELDLYQHVGGETRHDPSLTNMFVSMRYKFSRKLDVSLSYDNRKNIIYYETYKSFIDQIIDDETRQGLRFGVHYRPLRLLNWGMNASWRFQKSGANDSKNLNTYLNFSNIPLAGISASVTANFLQTGYIDSRIFGLRLMKDLWKGKVNLEAYYRRVDYAFPRYDFATNQNVAGASLSWQLLKKLGLYFFFEKTFDSQNNDYLLFNTKIMQRF